MNTKFKHQKFLTCTLLIMPVISVLDLQAQDYYITFSGSGKSTTVDSVIVENLTQGTKLVLKGTDTLHLVKGTTGIETVFGNLPGKIKFYPNPSKEQARMQFDLPEPGETMISMFDIAGREIANTREMLYGGRHTYLIQGVREGLYVIRIISGRYSYCGKLLCSGSGNSNVKIFYETTESKDEETKLPEKKTGSKGNPGRKDMPYNPGERLQYKTFGGDFSTLTTDVPSTIGADYTINSVFVDCSDADNNHYSTVLIGNQVWMGENLKTTKLTNGMAIPNITDNNEWGNTSTPAYCWYDNDPENKDIYGAIYNWYTAASNTVCPAGWHVPSDDDWSALKSYLGWFDVGGKLKQTGTTYWRSPNTGATNETGFTGLPGGYRAGTDNAFSGLHEWGYFWSSTAYEYSYSQIEKLNYEYDWMTSLSYYPKKKGGSIRCLRDAGYMKDSDGNMYTTIKIGSQQWMGENLKATRFRDGTAIPFVTNNTAWRDLNAPGYCWYENDDVINKNNYGALYNWYTVNTGKLCPTGWHVPTDEDWTALTTFYGGESLAGGALKETGTTLWNSPNNATNESGFTGRPGGFRDIAGGFYSIKDFGQWWSATEVLESTAILRIMSYSSLSVTRTWNNKGTGMSVRCLKDNVPEYIRDRDGNNYLTVTIGNQTWMAENLRAHSYNDGSGSVPFVTERYDWLTISSPGYCWYNNDQANQVTYGALYNWYAVNTGNLCPVGWHIPSGEDWTTLTNWLGGPTIAGGKLKESGTTHWFAPNTGATNFSGFTGMPGGYRFEDFSDKTYTANWWSSEAYLAYKLEYNKTDFTAINQYNHSGISVRCLKDQAAIIKDKDGNVYKIVKIGEQSWMGENLKTTHLNDGTAIPMVTNATEWGNLLTHGYCWYDNDEALNKDTYGALYNWPAVSSGKLCPAGWHVPSDADWTVLTYNLGGISFAGGKLKEAGTTHWLAPNLAATNETSFTALPGGYRSENAFLNMGEYGTWWSSSEMKSMPLYAYHRSMKYNSSNLSQEYYPKVGGMSVRYLKDGLKDYDGNNYATIQVGNQEWMAENLKTTHYNDGTEIPLVTNPTEWSNLETHGYCWYNNDEYSNKDRYGALYNFYTLLQPGEVCPAGWHVPLRYEWEELIEYLGGENVAGGKLKEAGFTHWSEPNTGATNETGFTALPGGFRTDIYGMVEFIGINNIGYWWTTQGEGQGPEVYGSFLKNDNSKIGFELKNWGWGLSIRCMRYK